MNKKRKKELNQKISRITILIPVIAIFIFIGVAFTMTLSSPTFLALNPNSVSEEMGQEIPGYYKIYELLGTTEGCNCLGNVYSDTTPPEVLVTSPPNNSLILVDTTIYIEVSDNFPAMDGGIPFVPEFVYYHWNNATSNITIYNSAVDEAPADLEPVRIELTIPNDEAGATHVLYIFAVDPEGNWSAIKFVWSTPVEGEESSVTWTTTTTTTTTEQRRTDGFLLLPMIAILIGSVNVITWRRRKKNN
jgi:hypothetical protein